MLPCGTGGFARGRIDALVADHEQRPAGCDAAGEARDHLGHVARAVNVEAQDDVVRARLRRPHAEVALDPGDALGDVGAGLGGVAPSEVERGGREVDGGDVPAVRGEPQGFRAVAGAGVENGRFTVRTTGGEQLLELTRDVGVRRLRGERVGVRGHDLLPALLPAVAVERGAAHRSIRRGR